MALVAAIVLLATQPYLRYKMSLTLVLVVVYGFMIVWLAAFNLFFVVPITISRSSTKRDVQFGAIESLPK